VKIGVWEIFCRSSIGIAVSGLLGLEARGVKLLGEAYS